MKELDEHYFKERERLLMIIKNGRVAEAALVRLDYEYAPEPYFEKQKRKDSSNG